MLSTNNLQQLKSIKADIRNSKDLHKAIVRGTRWRYGFARLEDGRDILLPHEEMLKVYPGDAVEVDIISDERKRPFAKIDKLFKSPLKQLVGKIIYRKQHCFLEADVHGIQQNLFVPPPFRKGAKDGHFALAEVIKHPFKEGKAQVKIIEILKNKKDLPLILAYINNKFQIPQTRDFSQQQTVAQQHLEQALAASTRKDLCDLDFITIDNEHSSDLDDALFISATESGWNLRIAIADPCELVPQNGPLEKQARLMGSTIYLPQTQYSMLPSFIATNLASLIPQEKRLALVCDMQISAQGEISQQQVYEAVICSKAKLSYTQVDEYLTQQTSTELTLAVLAQLTALNSLSDILYARQATHSIKNNTFYHQLQVDDNYALTAVSKLQKNTAQKLVETFMITCNHAVALWLDEQSEQAFIFNSQAGFRKSQLTLIQQLLQTRENKFSEADLSDLATFSQLMQSVYKQHQMQQTEPQAASLYTILSNLLERSEISLTQQAHFALGLSHYSSFTSPIRRYQDFLLHRTIKALLNNKKIPVIKEQHIASLNENLQRNKQAVQQTENWLICEYLEKHPAQEYSARISQMQGKLIIVSLDEYGIAGNLDMRALKDFKFNGSKMSYSSSEQSFVLGQSMQVKLMKIDWKHFSPVFSLVSDKKESPNSLEQEVNSST